MIEAGDRAIAETVDGEEDLVLVIDVLDETAGEYELPIDRSPTLVEYWGPEISADERVIRARHAVVTDDGEYQARGEAYCYPESKLSPVGGDRNV